MEPPLCAVTDALAPISHLHASPECVCNTPPDTHGKAGLARFRVLTRPRGGIRCSKVHTTPREALTLGLTGVCLFSFSPSRPSAVFTAHGASLRRRSRTQPATPDTTRRPCVRARARRDVDNRAGADLAISTRTAATVHFRLQTHLRDEPSLTQIGKSVPRRTCGFGSAFVGPAAPTRRL